MAKAFWAFVTHTGDGSEADPHRPDLPAVGGRWTCPGDIVRLTGSPVPHHHLLVGGVALGDDNVGDGHRHYVVKLGSNWQQVTVGATSHTHTLSEDPQGNLAPDYYLLFWVGSNADAVTIAGDPNCYPIVEAPVAQDGAIGDLDNTQWTGGEQTTWETRCLSILGIQLPAQVDRGKRLVLLFLGALLSRQMSDEHGYRLTS